MRVLIVEDEEYLAEAVRTALRREAIATDVVLTGTQALERIAETAYDVVVLDRNLPDMTGDDVCRTIVADDAGSRVLMLTAASTLAEKAQGFGMGADDYLTKPFEMAELVLRVRALGRRRASTSPTLEAHGITLDRFRREVFRDGQYVRLSRKQFAVLEVLLAADGGVISAEGLLERAWDENADPFTNSVRMTISSLRKRLGEPWIIHTVPGVGYRIGPPAQADA
ncbi:response regulator transcription factor [Oerskovia flava]|uniref:response regulator transcription factor n=1 Tax=Oerskovia flava TaxID=2986422 RepID=UPI00223F54A9|nr:response regulator transcription factor [Oerskovia sp. JB1-3-2]